MGVIIKAENISKAYQLGQIGTGTLSRDIERMVARLRGKEDPFLKIGETNDRSTKGQSDIVWSLRDLNFDIQEGDAVGIIGKNGAGKSTLLKILSRITSPTTGRIDIKGRVASLLEVGTGFHPELSGRENIYLNGAILGMRKAEIKSKFDEIVDFSGVARYVDTPVKRYSSGMYVRLAFAVAAHLEPEILIVDEVLAVGDADFQKKCLGKMSDVSKNDGRTILFVSHNMAAVKQLCAKGICLKNGLMAFQGTSDEAVNFYQNDGDTDSSFVHKGDIQDAPGNENIRILKLQVRPLTGETITISSGFQYELEFYNSKEGINLDATFEIRNADEVPVLHNGEVLSENKDSKRGIYTVIGTVPPNIINAGSFHFNLIFGENQRYALFTKDNFLQFEIENEPLGIHTHRIPGVLRMKLDYTTSFREHR